MNKPLWCICLYVTFSSAAIELIEGLLTYDPHKRLTASEALNHRFFKLGELQAIEPAPSEVGFKDEIDARVFFENNRATPTNHTNNINDNTTASKYTKNDATTSSDKIAPVGLVSPTNKNIIKYATLPSFATLDAEDRAKSHVNELDNSALETSDTKKYVLQGW